LKGRFNGEGARYPNLTAKAIASQRSIGTVNRDLSYLRQQAKYNIRRYIDERLPEDYEKCLVGLTAILREAWNT
jgi:hypothetical protein